MGAESIKRLLDEVDKWIPVPERIYDKPFLLPVEAVCSIPGRGTVITGSVERGLLRKGDDVEFVGFKSKLKSTATGKSFGYYQLEGCKYSHRFLCYCALPYSLSVHTIIVVFNVWIYSFNSMSDTIY